MTVKELHAKAGPLSNYMFYIVVAFLYYLVDVILFNTQTILSNGPLQTFLSLGFSLLIAPLMFAGLFGGIHQQQQTQDNLSTGGFLKSIKLNYWRMLQVVVLSYVFIIAIGIFLTVLTGANQPEFFGIKLFDLIGIPYSALTLFWFVAIVVERKLFRGLLSAIKLFFFNPYALLIGVFWGFVRLADTMLLESAPVKQAPLAIYFLLASIYAILRILVITYSLTLYKQINGAGLDLAPELETETKTAGDGLAKASFGFAFAAFLPIVHLIALVLGIIAIRRKKQFVMKASIACFVGGFFTIFYFLVIAGLVVGNVLPAKDPGYSFLLDANASLQPQVALLDQGDFQGVRQQLERDTTASASQDWTVDGILAIAASQEGTTPDRKAALEYFYTAAAKHPDQGEFYYYYGLTLLRDDQVERAGEQFKAALKLEPELEVAQKYLSLITSAYYPPEMVTAVLFFIILLVSFTVHEYGHAYSAWKLGDDTAKNLGRLTLNPIAHLDLFGSILLPGIMLLRQTGMVFGWAKPVPVDPRNFKNPRRDHMIVSFAGPATNLIIAMACFIILGFLMLFVRLFWPETVALDLATPYKAVSIVGPPFAKALVVIIIFIKQIFYTSLVLGCLNLLPFPPLDGSWILAGLLPGQLGVFFEKIRGFGSIIFLILVVTPVLSYLLAVPMQAAWLAFTLIFSSIGVG